MRASDDNWVQDLVVSFVKLWIWIIGAIIFVVAYVLRTRPRQVSGPQVAALPSASTRKAKHSFDSA